MECCALLGTVGEVGGGEEDEISKPEPEEHAKRVWRSSRLSPASSRRRQVNSWMTCKEHGWFIAPFKAQKEGNSLAPFWPQTPPCPYSGLRELAERIEFCNTIVFLCDNCDIDTKAKAFEEVSYLELTRLPDLLEYLRVRCPCYLEPKKKRDAEGRFVDVETRTNNTLTTRMEQWRQTLAEGTSERALSLLDHEV